ncbi:hypothetical protein QNO08_12950 [Arthrobacter sp. zg-Y820]|nr:MULTISPECIES: hypothetical protein [unclassified Arthrobacter]MCC9195983.1 hypothetical protein [Arthrobacter sp. zg-Y820]MDK1278842.1 hypothetical protein [Arthrobacter sp. zg.Y820]WIB08742.1 hypothetical protein QNO08_12950 [Arthrobacter sp. zg-Y820]
MDQNGSSTGTPGADGTGDEAAARTRFVYVADPEGAGSEAGKPEVAGP